MDAYKILFDFGFARTTPGSPEINQGNLAFNHGCERALLAGREVDAGDVDEMLSRSGIVDVAEHYEMVVDGMG